MLIFQIKEEPQHEILPQKSNSLSARNGRIKPLTFQNSKLAVAFQDDTSIDLISTAINNKKKSLYRRTAKSPHRPHANTVAVNSHINYQLYNIVPSYNPNSKTDFLKKKSLSILKTSSNLNTYRSFSTIKRSQTVEGEVKLSRTQILKSMLVQYDRNVESKNYLKNHSQQRNHDKSPFLTDLGDSNMKNKKFIKSLATPKLNISQQGEQRSITRYEKGQKIQVNEEQIQIIVRKSLREIEMERSSQRKDTAKSLISFTQKTAYLKKMRRVQNELQSLQK